MNNTHLLRTIQDLQDQMSTLQFDVAERGNQGNLPPSFSWVAMETEATATLSATDAVSYVLNKSTNRNNQSLLRYSVDGFTSATCVVVHTLYTGNKAAGITPTATGWDTAPTTLANATDEKSSTATGNGADLGPSAINQTYVQVDLGAAFNGYFYVERYYGGPNPTERHIAYQVSTNGTDWTTVETTTTVDPIAWGYWFSSTLQSNVRYLRISVWVDNAGYTATFAIREICFFTSKRIDTITFGLPPKTLARRLDYDTFAVGTDYYTGSPTGTIVARYQLHSGVEGLS